MRGVIPVVALGFALAGCSAALKEGVFAKGSVKYRVASLDEQTWRRVDFADADLAWVSKDGHVLSMNATCANHGDPSLEVLTDHLLFGFTDRELVDQRRDQVDGREALFSTYRAKMDGVPADLQLVVLKKNDCVHDFSYVSPPGQAAKRQADFERLVAGFKQEASP